jgi:cytochrome P450
VFEDIILPQYRIVGSTTYRSRLGSHSSVSTSDPENLQAILATRINDYSLGEIRSGNMFELLGHGIFTSDGEAWARYRQQLKPQFSRDQVSDLEAAERHLQILYRALPQNTSETIDIVPLLFRFTMDVSTEFLFGQSVNSQTTAVHSEDSGNKSDLQEEEKFVEAMTYSQEYIIWRLRLSKLWWLARSKKFRDACQTCKDFTSRFVQSALDTKRSSPPPDEHGKEKFVLLNALTNETRNPIELRDQMLHVLLAGRDTTAALLAWTIALLSRDPEVYARYRSVVLSHFGTATAPTEPMTFSSLKACKELTHLLYETIRVYPVNPINSRTAIRDTILPVGGGADGRSPVAVRKGEVVTYSSYILHRRKDLWGEDAEEWRPERWVGRKLGWEFLGFNGGPRVCIGRMFKVSFSRFRPAFPL